MSPNTTLRCCILICLLSITSARKTSPRIVIVGAGSAGIAAASRLLEHGFENVTILEAENRIGGRVYTTTFDNYQVDVGGQWVHGQQNNVAYELASPLGLLDDSLYEMTNFIFHDSQGTEIPRNLSDEVYTFFENVREEARIDLEGNNGSVGDYFETEFKKYFRTNLTIDESLTRQFIDLLEKLENAHDASDSWFNTSARGYLEFWDCPGNPAVNWKERGYGTILDILMKRYPNPEEELPVLNNTILDTEVLRIDYGNSTTLVVVETVNGEKYTADHVIVTPSLGVLKEQYQTLFVPELPEYKVKAIKGLSIGSVGKIYLSFEEPWWPEDFTGFAFLFTEAYKNELQESPQDAWLLSLSGFFNVESKPRLLLAWISEPGVRLMEQLPESVVFNQSVSLLQRFLGKTYNITKPTGMLRTKWHSNKHFRGTYSYRSMETEEADVWAAQLAEPLTKLDKPVVMFAGEATHSHYYSTVHGAIESGWREADKLVKLYPDDETD